jgi:hypothetical protein
MSSETLGLIESLTAKLRKEFDERIFTRLGVRVIDDQGPRSLSRNEMAGRQSSKNSRRNYKPWRDFNRL